MTGLHKLHQTSESSRPSTEDRGSKSVAAISAKRSVISVALLGGQRRTRGETNVSIVLWPTLALPADVSLGCFAFRWLFIALVLLPYSSCTLQSMHTTTFADLCSKEFQTALRLFWVINSVLNLLWITRIDIELFQITTSNLTCFTFINWKHLSPTWRHSKLRLHGYDHSMALSIVWFQLSISVTSFRYTQMRDDL